MALKLAILISGRGSNMQAIHRAIQDKKLDAEIVSVISDQAGAPGVAYARSQSLPVRVLERGSGESREDYDRRLIAEVAAVSPQIVALAGFMRLLSPHFIQRFANRIVNIHPSLLPSFPGLHAQRQALEAGVRVSGCTVHFVDEGCDTGPILDQRAVPVNPDDTEETLSARILEQEHRLYSACLQLIALGKVRVEGRKVLLL